MNGWLLAGTTFLASAVEAVEALTIVLAVGATRSWRSALSGAGWGLATLAAGIVVLGPVLVYTLAGGVLKTAIGAFLCVFGLTWLRKAILRYGGRKALHDEDAIFARQMQQLAGGSAGRDRLGFLTAYNAVLLEGLEVAVIVVGFGTASRLALAWAGLGATLAVIVVAAAGIALRRPLSRVPENALKFAVGIMLTSFGTLWCGEGLGIVWWSGDLALVFLVAFYLAVAGGTIAAMRARPVPVSRAA